MSRYHNEIIHTEEALRDIKAVKTYTPLEEKFKREIENYLHDKIASHKEFFTQKIHGKYTQLNHQWNDYKSWLLQNQRPNWQMILYYKF